MRILVTLMKPTEGKVLVNGKDLSKNRGEIRKMLGYLPQDFRFFSKLRTWEFLDYTARLAGIKNKKQRLEKVDLWLDKVGLFDARERSASKLSGGMKRRLMIARAMMHDPKLLILDEPTAGVDIEIRHSIWTFLKQLNKDTMTIILTTHYLEEAEMLCNNIAIINEGKIIENTSMQNLLNKMQTESFVLHLEKSIKSAPIPKQIAHRVINEHTIEVDVQASQNLNIKSLS